MQPIACGTAVSQRYQRLKVQHRRQNPQMPNYVAGSGSDATAGRSCCGHPNKAHVLPCGWIISVSLFELRDLVARQLQDFACQMAIGRPKFIQNREVICFCDRDQVARQMKL
jgi:hypothetical protein